MTRHWSTSTTLPEAVVVADPDRVAGAERALARGAQVLVLDDAYQRLDVRRDLNIAVMSAETTRAVAGRCPPVRGEGWSALDRSDAIIVTRKRATPEAAMTLARDLAGRNERSGRRGPPRSSVSRGAGVG